MCVRESVWRSKTEATTKTNESRKRPHTKIGRERESKRMREDKARNRVKEKRVEKTTCDTVRPLDRQKDRIGI